MVKYIGWDHTCNMLRPPIAVAYERMMSEKLLHKSNLKIFLLQGLKKLFFY